MGVYVRGMEMPKSCYACMFFAKTEYWNKEDEADILSRCKRTGEKTWESVNGYLPNCPLVPVPPHGRLISADALYEVVKKRTRNWNGGWSDIECVLTGNDIKNAPTVIEAEEDDT